MKALPLLLLASLSGCTSVPTTVCPSPPAELLVPVPQSLIDTITELTSERPVTP